MDFFLLHLTYDYLIILSVVLNSIIIYFLFEGVKCQNNKTKVFLFFSWGNGGWIEEKHLQQRKFYKYISTQTIRYRQKKFFLLLAWILYTIDYNKELFFFYYIFLGFSMDNEANYDKIKIILVSLY